MDGVGRIGELRCGACAKRGLYSRVLLRYAIGSIGAGGEIVVRCRDCRTDVRLTTDNQHCDGINTFFVAATQPIIASRTA